MGHWGTRPLSFGVDIRPPEMRLPSDIVDWLRAYCRASGLLLRPSRGVEYCNQPGCLCVCLSVREHIFGTAGPIFTKFLVHIPYARGSILLWGRYDTLCTSGFMDDVTFRRNGPMAKRGGCTVKRPP